MGVITDLPQPDGTIVVRGLLATSIGGFLVATLLLSQTLEGNWDEYNFLSKIFLLANGELSQPLQTFHTHLFTWLTQIGEHALDRILTARIVIWIIWVCTLGMLYSIGRRFLSPAGAWFALACLASFSFIIEHAASFRYDTLALAFTVLSIWWFGRPRPHSAMAAGAFLALAFMITIKTALLLPAWAGLAIHFLLKQEENAAKRDGLRRLLLTLAGAMIAGVLLLGWHWMHLSEPAIAAVSTTMQSSANKTLLDAGLWPRWSYLVRAVSENTGLWVALIGGIAALIPVFLRADTGRHLQAISLLLLISPLATLAFYRNAFPYYYVFCLPLPALLCGRIFDFLRYGEQCRSLLSARGYLVLCLVAALVAMALQYTSSAYWFVPLPLLAVLFIDMMQPRLRRQHRIMLSGLFTIGIAAALVMSALNTWRAQSVRSPQAQREVLDAVHQMFPEPVAYIDRCSMVAEYPKTGFFMSTWGMATYHAGRQPTIRQLVERDKPLFVLANHSALDLKDPLPEPRGLSKDDINFLREHYVQAWGPVWIVGKQLTPKPGQAVNIDIIIPGHYVVESRQLVLIEGQWLAPGEKLELESGTYRLEVAGPEDTVTLRIDTGPIPQEPSPSQLFNGFGRP